MMKRAGILLAALAFGIFLGVNLTNNAAGHSGSSRSADQAAAAVGHGSADKKGQASGETGADAGGNGTEGAAGSHAADGYGAYGPNGAYDQNGASRSGGSPYPNPYYGYPYANGAYPGYGAYPYYPPYPGYVYPYYPGYPGNSNGSGVPNSSDGSYGSGPYPSADPNGTPPPYPGAYRNGANANGAYDNGYAGYGWVPSANEGWLERATSKTGTLLELMADHGVQAVVSVFDKVLG